MRIPRNYKFLFVVGLVSISSLNSCSSCRNPATHKINKPLYNQPTKNKGIPNIGNTCYMNSVIQILASFYRKAFEKKEGVLAKAAIDLINTITSQEGQPVDDMKKKATALFDALKKPEQEGGINWKYTCGTQQDASELLIAIFNWLGITESEYAAGISNKFTNLNTQETDSNESANPWGPIWNVPMPGDRSDLSTMQDFFDNSLAPETLTGTNAKKWGNGTKAPTRKLTLLKGVNKLYGKMLVISLKRFEYGRGASKIRKDITNPFSLTISKAQTTDLTHDLHYELVGFIQHDGRNVGGGHYVAYTKVDDRWIYYNDKTVKEAPIAEVHGAAKQAYLFFYQQVTP